LLIHNADLQLILDLVGGFIFALSGGLVAVRKGLDLFGVLVLACTTALGGGVVRDVLIGAVPPVAFSDWRLGASAGLAGLVTFLFHPGVERISASVRILDAAALGLFAVSGSVKALIVGVGPITAVLVGVITAVGGGVLRDVLAGEVPEVLYRELNAVPALVGSMMVVVANQLGALSTPVAIGSFLAVFGLRMLAVVLKLNVPRHLEHETVGDLTPG
jgi:uncharacterized membrane protein YeiH